MNMSLISFLSVKLLRLFQRSPALNLWIIHTELDLLVGYILENNRYSSLIFGLIMTPFEI